jgi:hypothetical protein
MAAIRMMFQRSTKNTDVYQGPNGAVLYLPQVGRAGSKPPAEIEIEVRQING